MANNIQYSNAFGGYTLSTTEQADGSHALNVVMAQLPMRDAQVYYASPVGGSTNMNVVGGSLSTGTSTITTAMVPGAANYTRFRRTRYTGTAAAAVSTGNYVAYSRWFRGAQGGFDATIEFGQGADATGFSAFVGVSTLVAALAVDPSTLLNCVGVGYNAADAAGGTWFLINNDGGTAVKTAISGMTRDAVSGYRMRITCPVSATSNITVTIYNAHTGTLILNTTLTTSLPVANTGLSIGAHQYTGAIATSPIIDVSKIYVSCAY